MRRGGAYNKRALPGPNQKRAVWCRGRRSRSAGGHAARRRPSKGRAAEQTRAAKQPCRVRFRWGENAGGAAGEGHLGGKVPARTQQGARHSFAYSKERDCEAD